MAAITLVDIAVIVRLNIARVELAKRVGTNRTIGAQVAIAERLTLGAGLVYAQSSAIVNAHADRLLDIVECDYFGTSRFQVESRQELSLIPRYRER